MFEEAGAWILFRWTRGVVKHGVADVAIVADDFAGITLVLAIVTTETTRRRQVTDIVWVSLPVSLHFREKV